MRGHAAKAGLDGAIIVNTCAVTSEAMRTARQTIRRAARDNPDAPVIVTGCAAQIDAQMFADMPEVSRVIGNHEKMQAETWKPIDLLGGTEKIRVNDIMSVEETAGHLIDGMDGRVARLTNTQSAFGEQYDSLSDMTSFGVAPALVAYEFAMNDLGRWGWLAAFVYVAGAALRLARFNTNIGTTDKRFFQGLPSPAAAALVAGFVWLVQDARLIIDPAILAWVMFGLTLYAGMAMVTNAPFYSGKNFTLGRSVPFWAILALVATFVFVSSNPPLVLFALFVIYGLSGWFVWAWRIRRAKQLSFKSSDDRQY